MSTIENVRGSGLPAVASQTANFQDFIKNMEGMDTKPVTIGAQALDVGNTGETHNLRRGLVMSLVGGEYLEYDNTKSDGRETARAVLYDDVDRTVSTATIAQVCHGGTFRTAGLFGSDAAGQEELIARGSKFDDIT